MGHGVYFYFHNVCANDRILFKSIVIIIDVSMQHNDLETTI